MTQRYANVIKKKKRKVKRIDFPKKIGDYMDNLSIDLKNLLIKCDRLENLILEQESKDMYEPIDVIKMVGSQIGDNFRQIIKILGQRGIYKTVREKEQL